MIIFNKKNNIILLFFFISLLFYFFTTQLRQSFLSNYRLLLQKEGVNQLDSFIIKKYGFSLIIPDRDSKDLDIQCFEGNSPLFFNNREFVNSKIACQSKDMKFLLIWTGSGIQNKETEKALALFFLKKIGSKEKDVVYSCEDDYSFALRLKMPGHVSDCSFILNNKKYYFSVVFLYPSRVPYVKNSIIYFDSSETNMSIRKLVRYINYVPVK